MCILAMVDHHLYPLDLFLFSNPKCSVSPHPLLGSSDHLAISVDIDFMV